MRLSASILTTGGMLLLAVLLLFLAPIQFVSGSRFYPRLAQKSLVHASDSSNREYPRAALLNDGNLFVAYSGTLTGGTLKDVYFQIVASTGTHSLVGSETRVNQYTSSDQTNVCITKLITSGDIVLAWTSSGQDGSGLGVYARRYTAAGVAATSEFLVFVTTAGDQTMPGIAALSGGGYVICAIHVGVDYKCRRWSSGNVALDGSDVSVMAITAPNPFLRVQGQSDGGYVVALMTQPNAVVHFFAPDGTLRFQSPQTVAGVYFSLARLDDDSAVMAYYCGGCGGKTVATYLRKFSSLGSPMDPVVDAAVAPNSYYNPAIAGLDRTGFVVCASQASTTAAATIGLYCRVFDRNLNAQGTEFLVVDQAVGLDVDIVALGTPGDFALFTKESVSGQTRIYLRRYTKFEWVNKLRLKQGKRILPVNQYLQHNQFQAKICASATSNEALIVWTSHSYQTSDANGYGINAKRLDGGAAEAMTGSEVQVNDNYAGWQYSPACSNLPNGNYVVTWDTDSLTSPYPRRAVFKVISSTLTSVVAETLLNSVVDTGIVQSETARVAALANGSFVACWCDGPNPGNGGTSSWAMICQVRSGATGTVLGNQISTTENAYYNGITTGQLHAVAAMPDGGFVVAGFVCCNPGVSGALRVYSAVGAARTAWLNVDGGNVFAVQPLPNGNIMLVDVSGTCVVCQLFRAANNFAKDTTTIGTQCISDKRPANAAKFSATVAVIPSKGAVVVCWHSDDGASGNMDVYCRPVSDECAMLGPEQRVTDHSSDDADASIAVLANGKIVVTYTTSNNGLAGGAVTYGDNEIALRFIQSPQTSMSLSKVTTTVTSTASISASTTGSDASRTIAQAPNEGTALQRHRSRADLIAGSGTAASTDGTGVGAAFNTPIGVSWNYWGQLLFVAESTGTARVRMLTLAGVATSFSGGTFAACATVTAIAVYPLASSPPIFVSSATGICIKTAVAANDVLWAGHASTTGTTNAAALSARFTAIAAMQFLGGGLNLLVADACSIRIVTVADASVAAFAGSPGSCGDTDGLLLTASFQTITDFSCEERYCHVAQRSPSYRIRRLDTVAPGLVISSGASTTAGTGAQGSQNGPTTTATVDPTALVTLRMQGTGNQLLLFANADHRIRKVQFAYVMAVIGSGTPGTGSGSPPFAQFNTIADMVALSGAGGGVTRGAQLVVVETGNNAIRLVTVALATATPSLTDSVTPRVTASGQTVSLSTSNAATMSKSASRTPWLTATSAVTASPTVSASQLATLSAMWPLTLTVSQSTSASLTRPVLLSEVRYCAAYSAFATVTVTSTFPMPPSSAWSYTPYQVAECCPQEIVGRSSALSCLDAFVSCVENVLPSGFDLSTGLPVARLEAAPTGTQCFGVVRVCYATFMDCLVGVAAREGAVAPTTAATTTTAARAVLSCPWAPLAFRTMLSSLVRYAGSDLQRACVSAVQYAEMVSTCDRVASYTSQGNGSAAICALPSSTLEAAIQTAASSSSSTATSQAPDGVAALFLTTQWGRGAGCDHLYQKCPAGSVAVAVTGVAHAMRLSALPDDRCFRSPFNLTICSPVGVPASLAMTLFVRRIVGASGGGAAALRRRTEQQAAEDPSDCIQPSHTLRSCSCEATKVAKTFFIPVITARGENGAEDAFTANVTFCVSPSTNAFFLHDGEAAACFNPAGWNASCRCVDLANKVSLPIVLVITTVDGVAKATTGRLIFCTAPPSDPPAAVPINTATSVVSSLAGGPAAGAIQGADIAANGACARPQETPEERLARRRKPSAAVPFRIGDADYGGWLALLVIMAAAFALHGFAALVIGVVLAVRGGAQQQPTESSAAGATTLGHNDNDNDDDHHHLGIQAGTRGTAGASGMDGGDEVGAFATSCGEAVLKTQFPELPLKVLLFAYQGFAHESVTLAFDPTSSALGVALGVVGCTACVLTMGFFIAIGVRTRNVLKAEAAAQNAEAAASPPGDGIPNCVPIEHDAVKGCSGSALPPPRDDPSGTTPKAIDEGTPAAATGMAATTTRVADGTFIAYREGTRSVPLVVRWLFLPAGFWHPQGGLLQAALPVIISFGESSVGWATSIHLLKSCVVAVLSVVRPSDTRQCATVYAVLATVFLLFGIVFIGVRPHRSPIDNFFAALICVCTAAMVMSFTSTELSSTVDRFSLSNTILYAALTWVALGLALYVVEMVLFKKKELKHRESLGLHTVVPSASNQLITEPSLKGTAGDQGGGDVRRPPATDDRGGGGSSCPSSSTSDGPTNDAPGDERHRRKQNDDTKMVAGQSGGGGHVVPPPYATTTVDAFDPVSDAADESGGNDSSPPRRRLAETDRRPTSSSSFRYRVDGAMAALNRGVASMLEEFDQIDDG